MYNLPGDCCSPTDCCVAQPCTGISSLFELDLGSMLAGLLLGENLGAWAERALEPFNFFPCKLWFSADFGREPFVREWSTSPAFCSCACIHTSNQQLHMVNTSSQYWNLQRCACNTEWRLSHATEANDCQTTAAQSKHIRRDPSKDWSETHMETYSTSQFSNLRSAGIATAAWSHSQAKLGSTDKLSCQRTQCGNMVR